MNDSIQDPFTGEPGEAGGEDQPSPNDFRRQMKRANERNEELAGQVVEATALARGLDLENNPVHQRLIATYDGEPTVAAVTEFLNGLGVAGQPAATPPPPPPRAADDAQPAAPATPDQQVAADLAAMNEAFNGGAPAGGAQPSVLDVIGQANSQDEVMDALPPELRHTW